MKNQTSNGALPFIIVCTVFYIFYLFVPLAIARGNGGTVSESPKGNVEVASLASPLPDPCYLKEVYCNGEEIKTIIAEVTKYSAAETCDPARCINASGRRPVKGTSIACPREIPLGTEVVIDRIKYTCDDRTARWVDGRYDIFNGYTKTAYKEALEWGNQKKEVIIIQ